MSWQEPTADTWGEPAAGTTQDSAANGLQDSAANGFQDSGTDGNQDFGAGGLQQPQATGQSDAEAVAKAREHGWTEAKKLDYDAFNAPSSQPAWASSAEVYEWSGEEGEVGPRNEALEEQLFHNDLRARAGDQLNNLDMEATLEGPIKHNPVLKFEDAGLHPQVVENVQLCGYQKCTIIQAYCVPIIKAGHDIVAVAQTGSGKTAAYLVPIISSLMGKAKKLRGPRPDMKASNYDPMVNRVRAEPLVVIVCPTRELAQQIFDEARRLCYRSMLRPVCLYGGVPMASNIQELGKGCDILIGTPGRLSDFMDRPQILSMSRVKYTVIDEADEMLHPDWEEVMAKIMGGGDTNEDADHAYLMFSATFPKEARALAKEYMNENYMRIRVGRAGSSHRNVTQDVVYVDQNQKRQALYDLLFNGPPCRTLVFCNSGAAVEQVDDYLFNLKLPTVFMHSKRSQMEREDSMRSFKNGQTPILIATNIFGRGIDVSKVGHVINYDLPSAEHGGITEYIHRIGRTGRIGNVGRATSFYNDRNEDIAEALVNILLETDQAVPDFLEQYKPEGGKATFLDDTDDEDNADAGYATGGANGGDAGDGWGTAAAADGWGVEAPAASGTAADAWGQTAAVDSAW